MFIRSPLVLGILAVFLTACAMAEIAGARSGHAPSLSGPNEPWRCAIAVAERPGSVVFAARIVANAPITGSYVLQIKEILGGATVDQLGDFSVGRGQTQTLGTADLGGSMGDYDAVLTVTVAGKVTTCPTQIAP